MKFCASLLFALLGAVVVHGFSESRGNDVYGKINARSNRRNLAFQVQMSAENNSGQSSNNEVGESINVGLYEMSGECDPTSEYCVIDKASGKLVRPTVQEKERIFLDALQSYYASGRQLLTDKDFDVLKEDLTWLGSDLVNMNRKEVKYLSSVQAYLAGSPIISDEEFDELKAELKDQGSKFAVNSEPVCYIDTGICKATFKDDFFRTNLLFLPVGAILTLTWLSIGYELFGSLFRFNPILFVILGSPLISKYSQELTYKFIFQGGAKISYGPCPSCESENRIYFGDILGVEGFGDVAEVKCSNCKEMFTVQRATLRASTMPKL